MSDEEHEVWEETLEILGDCEAMQAIREANDELTNGTTFSFEQVFGHAQPTHP